MYCIYCGNETQNADATCDSCRNRQNHQEPILDVNQAMLPSSGGAKATMNNLKIAGFVAGVAAIMSLILSTLLAIIMNVTIGKNITALTNGLLNSYDFNGNIKLLSPYTIWRMSFLNNLVLKANSGNEMISGTVGIKFCYIILVLIPLFSFLIAWCLLKNMKLRSKFPQIFKQAEFVCTSKQINVVNLMIASLYGVVFALSSFVPQILYRERVEILDYNVVITSKFTFLSSLFFTFIVVLVVNLLITNRSKMLSSEKVTIFTEIKVSQNIFDKYVINASIVTLALFIVTLIKGNMWKQFFALVTLLPNIILIVMNAFLGGGIRIFSAGGSLSALKMLSTTGKIGAILLTFVFMISLVLIFVNQFLKFDHSNVKKYWIKVATVTGLIAGAQIIVWLMALIGATIVALDEKMRVGISYNIWITLLALIIIGFASGAAAFYCPNLFKVFVKKDNSETKSKTPLIIGVALFIISIILGCLIIQKGSSNSVSSFGVIGNVNDNSSSEVPILEPGELNPFNGGYVFYSSGEYYLYKKNKLSKLKLDADSLNGNLTFSANSNRILVEQGNKLMVIDGAGKEIYKQEITYDNLLATTPDFNKVAFWVDHELTIYNAKNNKFIVINKGNYTLDYDSGRAYFDVSGDKLYLMDTGLAVFNIASEETNILFAETPTCSIVGNEIYVLEDGTYNSIVDGSKLTYVYDEIYDEDTYESYYEIAKCGEVENKVLLTNLGYANKVFDKLDTFLITFINSNDYYLYDANTNQVNNISSEIRYLSMNSKIKGGN